MKRLVRGWPSLGTGKNSRNWPGDICNQTVLVPIKNWVKGVEQSTWKRSKVACAYKSRSKYMNIHELYMYKFMSYTYVIYATSSIVHGEVSEATRHELRKPRWNRVNFEFWGRHGRGRWRPKWETSGMKWGRLEMWDEQEHEHLHLVSWTGKFTQISVMQRSRRRWWDPGASFESSKAKNRMLREMATKVTK